MDIKTFNQADLLLLSELQPDGWDNIIPMFEFYVNSSFCYPIKITNGRQMVGVGTAIVHNDIAWLAHIVVNPSFRKRGIGRLITQTLVDNSKLYDCETIYLIATELGAPVYRKVGFEIETEYVFYKELTYNSSWETHDAIMPYSNEFENDIARIDMSNIGEYRMEHMKIHLTKGFVFNNKGSIEGFYLPSFGDGLIVAETKMAGTELMKLRIKSKKEASFPCDNLSALEFLSKQNYSPYKKAKRMILGKKRKLKLSNLYNRVGGYIG